MKTPSWEIWWAEGMSLSPLSWVLEASPIPTGRCPNYCSYNQPSLAHKGSIKDHSLLPGQFTWCRDRQRLAYELKDAYFPGLDHSGPFHLSPSGLILLLWFTTQFFRDCGHYSLMGIPTMHEHCCLIIIASQVLSNTLLPSLCCISFMAPALPHVI